MFSLARAVDKDAIEVNNHELPKKTLSTWFINLMKVLGALDSPKGMAIHSYNPSGVLKAIFHSSPVLMRIR